MRDLMGYGVKEDSKPEEKQQFENEPVDSSGPSAFAQFVESLNR